MCGKNFCLHFRNTQLFLKLSNNTGLNFSHPPFTLLCSSRPTVILVIILSEIGAMKILSKSLLLEWKTKIGNNLWLPLDSQPATDRLGAGSATWLPAPPPPYNVHTLLYQVQCTSTYNVQTLLYLPIPLYCTVMSTIYLAPFCASLYSASIQSAILCSTMPSLLMCALHYMYSLSCANAQYTIECTYLCYTILWQESTASQLGFYWVIIINCLNNNIQVYNYWAPGTNSFQFVK